MQTADFCRQLACRTFVYQHIIGMKQPIPAGNLSADNTADFAFIQTAALSDTPNLHFLCNIDNQHPVHQS